MTHEQIGTNSAKTEMIGGFTYSVLGPDQRESLECQMGLTKKSECLDLEGYDEKKDHLHHIERLTCQRKKKVTKMLKNQSFIQCTLLQTFYYHRPCARIKLFLNFISKN